VTNVTSKEITCAAKIFKKGETQFRDADLSAGKLAQISNHPSLKWVIVQDKPTDAATKETK